MIQVPVWFGWTMFGIYVAQGLAVATTLSLRRYDAGEGASAWTVLSLATSVLLGVAWWGWLT